MQPPKTMEHMTDKMIERNKKPPIESKPVEPGAWRYDMLRFDERISFSVCMRAMFYTDLWN